MKVEILYKVNLIDNSGKTDLPFSYSLFFILEYILFFFEVEIIKYLLLGIFTFYFIKNINDNENLLILFLFAYFTNFQNWFTRTAVLGESGLRLLFIDLIMFIFLFKSVFNANQNSISNLKIYYFLLVIPLVNSFLGIITNTIQFGYVFGEFRLYFSLILFFFIIRLDLNKFWRQLLIIIKLASIFWLSIVVYNLFFGRIGGGEVRVASSGFGSFILSLYTFILFYLYNSSKNNKYLIYSISVFILILLSGNRTIYVSVILCLIYLYFNKSISKRSIFNMILILVFFLSIAIIGSDQIREIVLDQTNYFNDSDSRSSFDWRTQIWEYYLDKSVDNVQNIFFGRPYGVMEEDISFLNIGGWETIDISLAHNDFISMYISNGLVFICLLFFVIIKNLKLLNTKINSSYFSISLSIIFISLIVYISANAESRFYGASILLWVCLGLSILYLNNNKKEEFNVFKI